MTTGARAVSDSTRTSSDSHDESAPFFEDPFENLHRTHSYAGALPGRFGQQPHILTALRYCHPASPLAVGSVRVLVGARTVQAREAQRAQGNTFLTVQGLGTEYKGLGMQRVELEGHRLLRQPSEPAAS